MGIYPKKYPYIDIKMLIATGNSYQSCAKGVLLGSAIGSTMNSIGVFAIDNVYTNSLKE
jgi:hypothetical protein